MKVQLPTDQRSRIKLIGLAVIAIFALIVLFNSWTTIKPGERGFMYKPFSSPSIDPAKIYSEGTFFMLPWNKMIVYDVFRKSNEYEQKFLDKSGMDIDLSVAINYNIIPEDVALLHLQFREQYVNFVDEIARGAFKDIIGRYTYEEVYSSKREELEQEMEVKIHAGFEGNFLRLNYVKIIDVVLPKDIQDQIQRKETQKQRNLTAKEKAEEERYLANALIEKARGDSAMIISATYKADAIRMESQALRNNPEYTELKKWEKWDGAGSPYGTDNVFGDKAITILKGQ